MITDPVEKEVAAFLRALGVRFVHEAHEKGIGLDFRCGEIYVEAKAYHTERVGEQLKRAPDIVLVQGIKAARRLREAAETIRTELTRLRARVAELEAENSTLRAYAENPMYCTKCGSCGEEGCCPAERCMYPGYAAEALKDRAESAERERDEARREIERLRGALEEIRDARLPKSKIRVGSDNGASAQMYEDQKRLNIRRYGIAVAALAAQEGGNG